MKKFLYCLLACKGLALSVSAQAVTDSIRLNKYKKVPAIQYGVASYYHDKFEGRTTANGEIFTQKKMTAASNKFPLNCWVRVTNTHTKKSIVVRIIDRMHHLNTRLIDLSRRAAEELQFIKRGLVRVKVEYLGTEAPEDWVEDQVNK